MLRADRDGRSGLVRVTAATLVLLLAAATVPRAAALAPPPWLPRYDLDIQMRVAEHQVVVRERVTWTNRHARPATTLVFNAHSHYTVPDKDIGFFAKTLEILRLAPSEAFDFGGPPLGVQKVLLAGGGQPVELPFRYLPDNDTALEVALPGPVGPGQCVTVEVAFSLRLPQKQGRWGQWNGITFLAQWLPVLAVYDDRGWQPVPFIPWHQPFFNEAGHYSVCVTLPAAQKLASTGTVLKETDVGDGLRRVELRATAREFALVCSDRFQEWSGDAAGVHVRCLALPEHAWYAQEMLKIACETIPVYCRWFGPYSAPEFTIVESFFGWNGNECGGLVKIDSRVFDLPHMALAFVDHLVSHEICHQWWYNTVGTNGYAETWMDEGLATYFATRLMDEKYGKGNNLLDYPAGFKWLPNIGRRDYARYGMIGTVARGEAVPTVGPLPTFGHLVNLMSMTYDRGSRIVGIIEDRLGPAAMLDFMRRVYARYYFRILRVADFQRELEEYTGASWQEFFDDWLYGKGMSDWCVEKVELERQSSPDGRWARRRLSVLTGHWPLATNSSFLAALRHTQSACREPHRVTVILRQNGECHDPTVLGFCLDGCEGYQVRVPISPLTGGLEIDDPPTLVEALPDKRVRVRIVLPCEPTQITVDPDGVLVDRNPTNNSWKPHVRVRLTPLYFMLDETDVTTATDCWNVMAGPWFFGATWNDPWYTRSTMLGARAGIYRTQEFYGGTYLGYRTNDRNVVAGVDGVWDHFPWPRTQVGFNAEQNLVTLGPQPIPTSRAVVYGRYVLTYGSSLYLPPFEYVETFASVQNRSLPRPNFSPPGADLFSDQAPVGVHYHKYFLTPYWDPEAGIAMDATVEDGLPVWGRNFGATFGQVSFIKPMPDPLGLLRSSPWLDWLTDTRWAFRLYGAAALPNNGQFFTLGGGNLFRGFDLAERQGSMVWIGSTEWRVPLKRGLHWDFCDHVAGVRDIYGVAFYDVGNAYLEGKPLGPVAHAVGAGLAVSVSWFGMIERTTVRFDVAKTVNADTPVQFWFGVHHPF